MADESKDVFICHTSADRESIARPLGERLEAAGIAAWIDEKEIRWGDSVTDRVNAGLRDSRYVIVILSPAFTDKPWPQRELMAALNQEASSGLSRVLPLLAGDRNERRAILEQYALLNDKRYMRWPEDSDALVTDIQALLGREASMAERRFRGPLAVETEKFDLPEVGRRPTQLERDRFARDTYREIRVYFGEGLEKLKEKDAALEVDIRDHDADHFSCKVYGNGDLLAQCKIWLGSMSYQGSDYIFFSESPMPGSENSYNESLSITSDRLAWEPLMSGFYPEEMQEGVDSKQDAAKYLWRRFIRTFRQRG